MVFNYSTVLHVETLHMQYSRIVDGIVDGIVVGQNQYRRSSRLDARVTGEFITMYDADGRATARVIAFDVMYGASSGGVNEMM